MSSPLIAWSARRAGCMETCSSSSTEACRCNVEPVHQTAIVRQELNPARRNPDTLSDGMVPTNGGDADMPWFLREPRPLFRKAGEAASAV